MEVVLGKKAGFCPGITNAVTKAEEQLAKTNELYCLGNLIHNKTVMEKLQKKGLKIVQEMEEVPDNKKIVIRTHGTTKENYEKLEKRKLEVVDLTCPEVLAIHKKVEEYAKKGYYILLLGEKKHVEVIGTFSFCGKNAGIIQEQEDVFVQIEKINKTQIKKVVIFSQTTFMISKFERLVEMIKRNIDKACKIEVNKTICDATTQKQAETREIAKQVDLMIILGGKNSHNTTQLYNISVDACSNAMQVETLEDLYLNYIRRFRKVGVMAGASTPGNMIKTVVKILEETETEDCI